MQHLEPLQGAVERYCRRSLRDRNAIEDVLQSAIANAYRDFGLYVAGTNFRAWFFRYVTFEILNQNRKRQRSRSWGPSADISSEETWQLVVNEPLFQALLDEPEAVLEQCEDAVAKAVWALAPFERAVLLLRAIGEFKYREMAEILQAPIGTIMSALSRGRLRLRQQLVDYAVANGLLENSAAEERP